MTASYTYGDNDMSENKEPYPLDMSEAEVSDALEEYKASGEDLINSHHSNFANHFKRFVSLIDSNRVLSHIVSTKLKGVDFNEWYKAAESTSSGEAGTAFLDWPDDPLARLSMQYKLMKAIASGEVDVKSFYVSFLYQGKFDDLMPDIIDQIIRPFTRDFQRLIERFQRDIRQTMTTSSQATNRHLSTEPVKNIAFVMMSISDSEPELEDVLYAIQRACGTVNMEAVRADKVEHSGRITDLILEYLRTSQYLICDLTTERPNVYYELGYCHGLSREVVLIAKHGTRLHFDIKDYNVIFYKNMTELEQKLLARLKR